MVLDAPPGPPCVAEKAIANSRSHDVMDIVMQTVNDGVSSGSVILRKIENLDAPSILATSYSSVGMLFRPDR